MLIYLETNTIEHKQAVQITKRKAVKFCLEHTGVVNPKPTIGKPCN